MRAAFLTETPGDVFIYLQIAPFCNKQMGYCLKTATSLQWNSFIFLFLNQLSVEGNLSCSREHRPVDAPEGQLRPAHPRLSGLLAKQAILETDESSSRQPLPCQLVAVPSLCIWFSSA